MNPTQKKIKDWDFQKTPGSFHKDKGFSISLIPLEIGQLTISVSELDEILSTNGTDDEGLGMSLLCHRDGNMFTGSRNIARALIGRGAILSTKSFIFFITTVN